MRKIRLFTLFVILLSLLTSCAPASTSTPTVVPPTNTAVPATNTPVLPTTTPILPAPAVTSSADFERVAISLSNVDQIEALLTLDGHKDGVTGLVFLPDATHLASLSGDLVLSLWDIKSGQKVNTLTEPGARVYNVAFSPNGELLAVGNPDNTIGIRSVENGQVIQTISKRKSFVMKVAFSPDSLLLASGGAEGEITVWNANSGQELCALQAPQSPIGSLAFSSNGELLASGNAEGNTDITLWDVKNCQSLSTLGKHRGNVYNLVFTPDGKQLISSSGDLTIKFWDIESGQETRTLKGHRAYVYGLALSPDGNLLASASADGAIKLWEAKSGKELRTLDSHDEYIYFLAFSPDGTLLASSVNKDKAIILWGIKASDTSYLGQTPPGLEPQVFAPGIVSIPAMNDYAGTFSPDGAEFYFTRGVGKQGHKIYETHLVNGAWTTPAPVAFAGEYDSFEPHVTLDNKTLYFASFLPLPPGEKSSEGFGIWAVDRTPKGWSAPRYVGEGMFVSSDQHGQIYVTNNATRSLSKATLTDGRFTKLEYISAGIHPAIAPDGSYLVYDDGDGNLTALFPQPDGSWGGPKSLALQGIPVAASIATISPDGKYLFYTYKGDLYWVSTAVIENLRDK